MKKGVVLLFLFSIILASLVVAQDEEVASIEDKAYTCIQSRFNQTDCDSLSSEGRIFALLTLGKCKDEVLDDSNYESDLKYTAQAVLALNKVGVNVDDTVEWLLEQNKIPTDMIWYLQIDSTEATSCTIEYGSTSNTIDIAEDKKISSNAGTCLTRATEYNNYWYKINPTCYEEEFEISCDRDFITTLLFKKPNDNTIHVAYDTHSEKGGGTTTEQINFLCFQKGNVCNYEGTLWSTLVLDYLNIEEDLSPYKFYLSTLSDNYPTYLPSSFLFFMTAENKFENELIELQNKDGSWKKGTDAYYDTAVALLSVPKESTSWKNAISWLEKKQEDSGCWNSNNFVDTAFISYVVWQRGVSLTGGQTISTGEDCVDAGYFCMSGASCTGEILSAYDCSSFDKCCSKEESLETCEDLSGEICNSNQQCAGGTSENTFDLSYGQTCCVAGACEAKTTEEFTCASSGGTCRYDGCSSGEESSFETCEFGDTCCVKKTTASSNYLWLWILIFLILIGLVVLGIFKRDKLREYWIMLKSKFSKSPPSSSGARPPYRPSTPGSMQRRMIQGRPQSRSFNARPSRIARPSSKAPSEINDVLKRLKEMGK
jgi:hypothetical protein